MAEVPISSDFGAQEVKSATVSTFPPSLKKRLLQNTHLLQSLESISLSLEYQVTIGNSQTRVLKGSSCFYIGKHQVTSEKAYLDSTARLPILFFFPWGLVENVTFDYHSDL